MTPEQTLRIVRWQVAFNVLNSRGVTADELTKNSIVKAAEDFLPIILWCNRSLGLPDGDGSEAYLQSILSEGLPPLVTKSLPVGSK